MPPSRRFNEESEKKKSQIKVIDRASAYYVPAKLKIVKVYYELCSRRRGHCMQLAIFSRNANFRKKLKLKSRKSNNFAKQLKDLLLPSSISLCEPELLCNGELVCVKQKQNDSEERSR